MLYLPLPQLSPEVDAVNKWSRLLDAGTPRGQDKLVLEPPPLAVPGQVERMLSSGEGTMRPIGPRTVRRAIAIIEDSQYSHRRALAEPERVLAYGTPAFHRQCIKDYEQVLRLLRRVLETVNLGG